MGGVAPLVELPLNTVIHGKCLEVLKKFPDNSVDSIVTDVPYGLGDKDPSIEDIIAYLQGAPSLGPLKKGRQHCANSVVRVPVVPQTDHPETHPSQDSITFRVVLTEFPAVSFGVVQFDNELTREQEVYNVSTILDLYDMLVRKGDAYSDQGFNDCQLCLRERQSFPGCIEACSCFTQLGPATFSVLVRLPYNPFGEPKRSADVMADPTTEIKAVLTLDVGRRTGELSPADPTDTGDSGLLISTPEDVGASSGAGGLLSILQVLLTGKIHLPTDRALSFNVAVPIALVDRFHSPRVAQKDFMGKDWEIPSVPVWKECFRVLKPGGFLLSFAGTRTSDIISMGLRAAGFENRDTIDAEQGPPVLRWVRAQGMPKSTDISKELDKKAGVEREVLGPLVYADGTEGHWSANDKYAQDRHTKGLHGKKKVATAPSTPEAQEWEGWGTALKPYWEPILVFRKPIEEKTLVGQVLATGTGGLNIKASRVKHSSKKDFEKHKAGVDAVKARGGVRGGSWKNTSDLSGANEVTVDGRYPPNVLFVHSDLCRKVGTTMVPAPVINRFEDGAKPFGNGAGHPYTSTQTGDENGEEEIGVWECHPSCPVGRLNRQRAPTVSRPDNRAGGKMDTRTGGTNWRFRRKPSNLSDSGGVSRYFANFPWEPEEGFFYVPKPSLAEKSSGLEEGEENDHSTVKPIKLMAYLVRMATRPGGIVLDPYCGSGSTGVAAIGEGMSFIGIEKEESSVRTALSRLEDAIRARRTVESQREAFDLTQTLESD
jgi:DNA modification methylase